MVRLYKIFFVVLFILNKHVTMGQSAVALLDTTQVILNDNSNDYSFTGPHANAKSPYDDNSLTYTVRFNRGTDQNMRLDGFTHASTAYYSNIAMDYFIKIIRVDSTMNIGVRELLFYQRHGGIIAAQVG